MSSKEKCTKKKPHNRSESDRSNSDRMRDSYMLRNEVLYDVQNVGVSSVLKNSRRSQASSTKRKPTRDQPPRNPDDKHERKLSYSYSNFSKMVDEKNSLILTQEKQIDSLKVALEKQKRDCIIQCEKVKLDDLALLKKYQRENQSLTRELEKFKSGIYEIKSRMESLERDKNIIQSKYSESLKQNTKLAEELAQMQRYHREKNEPEKQILQQRCNQLEEKVNQYVLKCQGIQGKYKEQRKKSDQITEENSKIKIKMQQLLQNHQNLKRISQQEKGMFTFETSKLIDRISKLENSVGLSTQMTVTSELKDFFNQLDNKINKIEQNKQKCILEEYEMKISEQKSLLQQKTREYQMLEKLVFEKEAKINDFIISSENLKNTLENVNQQFQKQKFSLENNILSLKTTIDKLEKELHIKKKLLEQLSQKTQQLINENERIHRQQATIKNSFKIQRQKKKQTFDLEISKLKVQIQGCHQQKQQFILLQIKNDEKINNLSKDLQVSHQRISQIQKMKSQEAEKFNEKIQIMEKTIVEKKQFYQMELNHYGQIIKYKEDMIRQINEELKQIKNIVSQYKNQLEIVKKDNQEIQRQLNNEIFMRKEEEAKFFQELSYYRNKYEKSFCEIMHLQQKISLLENQKMDHTNRNAQNIKRVCMLEEEINKCYENKRAEGQKFTEEIKKMNHLHQQAKEEAQILRMRNQKILIDCSEIRKRCGELENVIKSEVERKNEAKVMIEKQKEQYRRQWEGKITNMRNQFQNQKYFLQLNLESQVKKMSRQKQNANNYVWKLENEIQALKQRSMIHESNIIKMQKEKQIFDSKNIEIIQELQKERDILKEDVKNLKQIIDKNRNVFIGLQNRLKLEIEEHRITKQKLDKDLSSRNEEIRKIQLEYSRLNQSIIENNHKKSRDSLRELESFKLEIKVLNEENLNLQQIMDQELSKRKEIIEDLIREKKILYEQLANKN